MPLPKLSLRWVLVTTFVCQTCLAVGLTAYITLSNSRRDIEELSTQLQTTNGERIKQRLQEYLSLPVKINEINVQAVQRGILDLDNFDQTLAYFRAQMENLPFGYISFTNVKGEFIGVERLDDGQLTINRLEKKTGLHKLRVLDTQNRLIKTVPYQPLQESWYKEAIEARQTVWSSVYQWNDKPEVLSLAIMTPLYDRKGNLRGIIGIDLILSQINQYLQSMQTTANGRIFILDRSGMVIACSGGDAKGLRTPWYNSPDPLVRSSGNFLQSQYPDWGVVRAPQQLSFWENGAQYFVRVLPYRDQYGLDWLVVMAVPESDFSGTVHQSFQHTLILLSLITLVSLGTGVALSRWIARPIQLLNEDAQHIAQDPELSYMEWQVDQQVESSPIWELNGLATSFYQMANRLQEVLDKLHRQAYFDPITGAGNHNFLRKRIHDCLVQKQEFVLLYLDLDRFKSLQYAFGHQTSETLVVEIFRRLQQCTSPKDTVARIGIGEFAVLFCELGDRQVAAKKAEEIHQSINAPFHINGSVISSTSSIGVVSSHMGDHTPESYLDAADTAMHYAKLWGKGRTVFFNAGMQTLVTEKLQLESDLKQAIAESQLHLNYQPIVNIHTGEVVSFEALVRWRHPRRGMMPPTKFISIAEETGLIIPLGRWVMTSACAQIRRLHNHHAQKFPLSIGVNLSEVQLRYPRLLLEVDALVQQIPAGSLKLELTETCLMENTEMTQTLLEELKARSIQLLIDDFGTGYSSLSYLQRLPVDTLKIDRSFVTGIEVNPRHLDITRAVITLAHSLGMDVVAEGLETREQVEILQGLGCEYGQGYLFAKPLEEQDVIPYLENYRADWL